MTFKKVAIIGVGLIGGSIGMALKKQGLAELVCGLGRRLSSIKKAVEQGAIDIGTLSLKKALEEADLVIIATPVGLIVDYIEKIVKYAKPGCIITDVGSTKAQIVYEAERFLPPNYSFVGAHPLVGSEKRGVEFASSGLFENSICILTKTRKTDPLALKRLKALWEEMGAIVKILSPGLHDKLVAQISHLPHLVATALVNSTRALELELTAGGFKDATRIASSNPAIWKDICVTNSNRIVESIERFQATLARLKRQIARRDERTLLEEFRKAKAKRDVL